MSLHDYHKLNIFYKTVKMFNAIPNTRSGNYRHASLDSTHEKNDVSPTFTNR